jgi:hypothetical protein
MSMSKLKLWQEHPTWEEAEKAWDGGVAAAAQAQPVEGLRHMPKMVGITPDTAKNLKWKSFKWMLTQDVDGHVRKGILKHPLRYAWAFLKSVFRKKSYTRSGDLFFYGVDSLEHFKQLVEDPQALFVLGFSYCHKPFECPSQRFSADCIHDPEHPVCRQCFIGKAINALPPENAFPLLIPTVHYIGGKIFEIAHSHPNKKIVFIITACEMTLEMFGDWGNMVGIQGIGIKLDGRICNTMKAFELSERGIKPGLTVISNATQQEILMLLKSRREASQAVGGEY